MKRAVLVAIVALVCYPMASFGQGTPIALTDKITSLDGVWIYDPSKGVRGSCPNTNDQPDRIIRIGVSPPGVNVECGRLKQLPASACLPAPEAAVTA